jgi:WD40 repeat protein/serine/threonine protein kinase
LDRSRTIDGSDRLYDVLLDYLELSERGLRPDSAEFVALHPEFAPELREFLETQDRLDGLTAPLREVSRAVFQAVRSESFSLAAPFGMADPVGVPRARNVGTYEIIGEIGRGGMGVVYKARDEKLGRVVALKMLRSANHASAAEITRFLAEARAKARLNHPNVVPLYEIGESDGLPYFVMALVEGGSLHARLADGPLPALQAAAIMQQVAEAIQHAHEHGVLHRDLKPHNILIRHERDAARPPVPNSSAETLCSRGPSAAQPVPMVSDFGLARLTEQEGLTATGEILGTPGYMPPEQAAGRVKDIGPHSDIYSLGAVLYSVLTGRPPFQAATMLETLRLVQEQAPVPPRRLNPGVTHDLEAVCLKCLEKEPERRYARAADLAADLRRFIAGKPTLARPRGKIDRVWQWARRRPALAGMATACAAAVLTLAAGAVLYTLQLRAHNVELGKAREQEQSQKEQAEARGRLLQRRAYGDGIRRAAECWENLRAQLKDQESGRSVGDVLSEMPRVEDCVLSAPSGGSDEDLRGFEWRYLRRLGSGIRVLRGHRGDVADVMFSPDGGLAAAAGGNDGTARLWDVSDGKQVWCIRRRGEVDAVALSADGRLLALTERARVGEPFEDNPGDLQVWDRQSGEQVANLTFGARHVSAVAFAPDGHTLAAAAAGQNGAGLVMVWEVGSWKQRYVWRTTGAGTGLCFSADSRALAEAQPDAVGPPALRVHDLQTGQSNSILLGRFADAIMRLAFAPDGRTLASGGCQGQVVLWDTATGTPRKNWSVPQMVISGLAFLPGGEKLAVAAKTPAGSPRMRATVQLWDVATAQPCSDAWGPGGLIHNLAVAPDRTVALACGDTTVRLWNPERLSESRVLPWNHKETWTVAFAPDGQTLATAGDDGKVKLWDMARSKLRASLMGHLGLVSGVAFHPDGKVLASIGYDGKICLWDVASGSLLGRYFKFSAPPVRCLAFAPDGRTLATGGRDHTIRLWDIQLDGRTVPEPTLRAELTGHAKDVLCLAFRPDGQLLASGCDDRTLRLWDVQTGAHVRTIEEAMSVRCVAFHPDGRLVWGTDEGEVKIAGTAEDSPVSLLAGHSRPVRTLALTRDGRTLASGGEDNTVRLWQLATGQALMTLRGHEKPVYAASFAPNGQWLATGSYDGTVRLWPAELEAP